MIYDSFQFFNELDLLDIRLHTHDQYVDKFIITESTKTHQNHDKPLVYFENKHLFEEFKDKIIHVVLDKFPDDFPTEENFVRDFYHHNTVQLRDTYQRMYVFKALQFNDNDVIMLLDTDELLDFRKLKISYDDINSVTLKNYYYYLNNESSCNSDGGIITKYKNFKSIIGEDYYKNIRQWSKYDAEKVKHIHNIVGWHFSFLGGEDKVRCKIESWSHPEFNTDEIKNKIHEHIKNNTDIFNRKEHSYKLVNIDDSFPMYVLQNKEKFSHLIYGVK